jgi:RNA polymerase sigma-70 factor (ECF subfamily)
MPPTDSLDSTSQTLLARVQRFEPEAWERFLCLYGPLVYGWCLHAGLNSTDAADVVQEVFTSVFKAIHTFNHGQPGNTLRGWLRVICRNKLNDFFRHKATIPEARGGNDATLQLAEIADFEDDASSAQNDRHWLVRRAAQLVRDEFEETTWQAFWLVAVEHRKAADTAAQLGLTTGAVRQAKYMVLRRLRAELSDELE